MTRSAAQPTPLNPRWCLAHDTIDREDIDRLIAWLRTYPRLTKGPVTLEFESQWNAWLGRSRSVHCNSGSSANLLMYYTLLLSGRLRNKKVIVPSVGWVTSIAPAIQFGFEPIMCEADPETFGLDLTHLEDLLRRHGAQTVMLVQVLGVPHKMREMEALKGGTASSCSKTPAPRSARHIKDAASAPSATWRAFRSTSAIRCPPSKAAWFRPTILASMTCC
jgi:CDP-4-dehydro-6-deoxyglucose reductase, E1